MLIPRAKLVLGMTFGLLSSNAERFQAIPLRVGASQHRAGSFVDRDLVEEVADLVEILGGDQHVFNFVRAFVVENVVGDQDLAFVGAVGTFGVHWFGKFVHHVAWRQGDIEDVVLARSFGEFDGIFARFAAENAPTFGTNDARAENQQVAGRLRIAFRREFVFQRQAFIVFFKVANRGAGQGKI